jgi:CRP-like cAMP-binding protein/LysM repeat protein
VAFLSKLDAADLHALTQRMEEQTYESGDLVYSEGEPGDGLYFVESGTVAVLTSASCDGEVMAHLPKGSTFGESALLSDRPRSSAVRAASDCKLMLLTRAAYEAFIAEHPAAGQVVSQTLLQRPARGARQLMTELLKPMPLFAGIQDNALLALTRKLQATPFCANALVFSAGEDPDALYLVENGGVQLLTGQANARAVLAEIGPHDFFGEDALLTDQSREFSALATVASDLWALPRADFDEIANTYPAAAIKLTRALAARSERWNRQLLATAATLGAAPVAVPIVRPAVVIPKPKVKGPSLLDGMLTWIGRQSYAGKALVVVLAALLAWLLFVSLPSTIASGLSATRRPVLDERSIALVESARGGVQMNGAVSNVTVPSDLDDAPLTSISDLVVPTQEAAVPTASSPAAAAPAPADTPTPAVAASYTVVPGDTLFDIAQNFKVDLDVLAAANSIDDPSLIHVGQELAIPGGEEQKAIAVQLAAMPRPTATPVPQIQPEAVQVAAAEVKPAAPPVVWDSRLDKWNIHMEPAAVAPGQPYYRLTKAIFRDTGEVEPPSMPNGDHNIYVEVLDENGKRIVGVKAIVRNGGTTTITTEDKPFPEYGANFPMYGMMGSYSMSIDGLPSDTVIGMGLPMHWHVTYYLTFQKTSK